MVKALSGDKGQAEMTTDAGAIYVTDNTAYTWSAAVQETVDATLNRTVSSGISGASYYEGSFSNIARSSAGEYVAVSSRGNFYMTWAPGQTYWQPHNRPVARRVQVRGSCADRASHTQTATWARGTRQIWLADGNRLCWSRGGGRGARRRRGGGCVCVFGGGGKPRQGAG